MTVWTAGFTLLLAIRPRTPSPWITTSMHARHDNYGVRVGAIEEAVGKPPHANPARVTMKDWERLGVLQDLQHCSATGAKKGIT